MSTVTTGLINHDMRGDFDTSYSLNEVTKSIDELRVLKSRWDN